MNPTLQNHEDLLTGLGPIAAAAVALLAFGLWAVTLFLRGRTASTEEKGATRQGLIWHLTGFVLVSVGTWAALQLLGRFVTLATAWPLLGIAVGTGLFAELILWLYRFERTLVKPGRGRWIAALRLLALAVLALILAQPVLSYLQTREIERELAILVDDSDSMLLSDQRLSASEMLDRAALLSVAAADARPDFASPARLVEEIAESVETEIEALRGAPSPLAGLESRASGLESTFAVLSEKLAALGSEWDALFESGITGEVRSSVEDYRKRTRDGLVRILAKAEESAKGGDADELLRQLEIASGEIDAILDTLDLTRGRADEAYLARLDGEARAEVEGAAATARLGLARAALAAKVPAAEEGAEPPLLSRLAEDYNLRVYRFARGLEQVDTDLLLEPGIEDDKWGGSIGDVPSRARTDLAGALDHVLENTSPESLAGVLVLSDGRHNADALPEDALRRLAVQNSPLSAVPVGGRMGPVDISLLGVNAPESVYLDDRVVVRAEAKMNGVLGKKVSAELLCDGEVVDTIEIDVPDVAYRTEISFVHRPETDGIVDYTVRLATDEQELFPDNNEWDFKVAVTDDRTNVLLVDGLPRWEFRYLRNLFYGRDKSVHLQYVLLQPDTVYRGRKPDPVHASATRPFGDAEASLLPASPEEWALFDVIILGDFSPTALGPEDWKAIEENVTKRGAMLVCVAGALHMPHAFSDETLRSLLPIVYESSNTARFETPEDAYRVALTATGRNHPVMSQSTSRTLNEDRWSSFPPMQWRFVPGTVKETAEVLSYAVPVGAASPGEFAAPDGSPGSVEAALEQLANRTRIEQENALVVAGRSGLGKVLMLNFDQTWRLRYGVGDTHHHRFWGQITRWGAGESLRSGNDQIRLGTDRLTYTPEDPVEVVAKVLDEDRRPIVDAEVEVEVWKDGTRLTRQTLGYRTDSSGIYETSLAGLRDEGAYEIKLVGDEIEKAGGEISTELLVVTSRNPVELAELTADRDFLVRATSITGGKVAELGDLSPLIGSFGAPKETLTERRNVTLWDTWPLLLAFLGFLTAEWIVRRRSGLV